MKSFLVFILSTFTLLGFSQEKLAYQIFDKKGKKVTYETMFKSINSQSIILFGEYHDNPIIHWLQYELLIDLHKKHPVIIGAEMLESDVQPYVEKYLKGEINQQKFDTVARLWNNYKTDYKPIVDYAKQNNLSVIATNIPRRFASMVYKQDFESLNNLSETEKSWIAPLPILYDENLPSYKNMLTMMGDHPNPKLPKAQAIKDATMAFFIHKNLKKDYVFYHLNGSYHSDYYEGIYWYLKNINKELSIVTIASATQKQLTSLETENKLKADYIIVVNEHMTKTF